MPSGHAGRSLSGQFFYLEVVEAVSVTPLGDEGVVLSLGNDLDPDGHRRILAVKRWLGHHPFPGLRDVVVAYSSVAVLFDLVKVQAVAGRQTGMEYAMRILRHAYEQAALAENKSASPERLRDVPVCYDHEFAPDMDFVRDHTQLSRDEVIGLHSGETYTVYMVGFLPGFPYMAKVDDRLVVPRKSVPAQRIRAGSVGLAGVQTGIYSVSSPGGWQIIGCTPWSLFDAAQNPPAVFQAGDRVRFHPVTRAEFDKSLRGQ